ncbi:unnamed protein product [Dracunculus medinensis]|uniref:AMP-binding domain-containing protein n=1 Tax=Dracunculus medinensis TaxID=318479 RepID=A0A0N4UNJ4_DRAME|nr:unnamed protein product [Dracunculus medinensis]
MEIQNPFQIIWENSSNDFAAFFNAKFAKYGSQLAMIDLEDGKQWRYSELCGWVEKCAKRLQEIGVAANTRIAMITCTTCQVIFVQLACSILQAVVVGINGYLPIGHAKYLFKFLHKEIKVIADVLCDFESFANDQNVTTTAKTNNKTGMMIFFSEGSTDPPKPTEISHQSIVINVQQLSCPVFSPPMQNQKFLLAISMLVKNTQVIINNDEMLTRFYILIQKINTFLVYGLTTASGFCTFSKFGNNNYKSVGVPLPGMVAKIVNIETNELCMPHQPGRLYVIGPQIQIRSHRSSKASNSLADVDGYLNTGDFAFYDRDGYIYIIGKIKNLIKYRGTLTPPSQVETFLLTHPGIEDCAVIGRQDALLGEVPAAFVVKTSKYSQLSPADVRQHVFGKIGHIKELRGGVFFVNEIPRSSSGKIIYRQLKQTWERDRSGLRETNSSSSLPNIGDGSTNKEKRGLRIAKLQKSASKPVIQINRVQIKGNTDHNI